MKLYLFIVFWCVFHVCAQAQETVYPRSALAVKMPRKDTLLIGTIAAENRDTIFLKLLNRDTVMAIPRIQVEWMDVPAISGPQFDPLVSPWCKAHLTNYFLQGAYAKPQKGEWRYATIYGLAHGVEAGITENWSLAMGILPFFIIPDAGLTPVWIAPRFSTQFARKVRWGATGVFAMGYPFFDRFDDRVFFGTFHTGFTFGNVEEHATIGGGIFLTQEEGRMPFLSGAFQAKLNKRVYFLSESMYYAYSSAFSSDDRYIHSCNGLKIVSRRVAFNIGAMGTLNIYSGNTDIYIMPLLSLMAGFGKPPKKR
jgi:hypothetical protein